MNRAEILSPPVKDLILASAQRRPSSIFWADDEVRAHEASDIRWMLIAPGDGECVDVGGFAVVAHDSSDAVGDVAAAFSPIVTSKRRDSEPLILEGHAERPIVGAVAGSGAHDTIGPSGLILRGCCYHERDGSRWIGWPAKPFEKQDGTKTWSNIVDFVDNKAKYLMQDEVLQLVLAAMAEEAEANAA